MQVDQSARIRELMREGKEGEISKESLLESLRERGVSDLDTLAEGMVRSHKESQALSVAAIYPETEGMSQEHAMAEIIFGKRAELQAKSATHSPPKLPFVLGKNTYRPQEISRFDGKGVHFVWDERTIGNGILKAVADRDEYLDFLARPSDSSDAAGTGIVAYSHVPGESHTFYQHINFSGYALTLAYRHAFPDLTAVTMSGWWFWATSWNDQISSLRTGGGPVLLGEHIMNPYLTGATMTFGSSTSVPWIGVAWNDRVSAILG